MHICTILVLLIVISVELPVSQGIRDYRGVPYVRTPLGRVKGHYKTSYKGRRYAAFEGVPYATPPLNNLRFQPPKQVRPWQKKTNTSYALDATSVPNVCTQYDPYKSRVIGQEDCLYASIYTPCQRSRAALPVLLWIHGGIFHYGGGRDYGAKYLMDRELVFVNFNYRVGPLGFLSTEDDLVPGNMGMKDQSLALRWLSKHVEYFGGDPTRITIAGVSAGSGSVHYHYLSPMSRGLFRNGISFSTTALSPYCFSKRGLEVAQELASLVNCTTRTNREMVDCLLVVPAPELYFATHKILLRAFPFWIPFSLFAPVAENVKENYFINRSPLEILESGDVYDAPWLTGVVQEEGSFVVAAFVLKEESMAYADKHFEELAPFLWYYNNTVFDERRNRWPGQIRRHYFGNRTLDLDAGVRQDLIHATGNAAVVIHAEKAARMQAKINKSPVRFYFYSYKPAQSFTWKLSNTTVDLGVSHDDDILLVLENSNIDPTTTPSDRAMLEDMLDFWYSVVSTGEPNLGIQWDRVDADEEEFRYMHIAGPKNWSMDSNANLGDKRYWKSIDFLI